VSEFTKSNQDTFKNQVSKYQGVIYYSNFVLTEQVTKYQRKAYTVLDVLGEAGGIIEILFILAGILLIPFNYNLNKIIILKDFISQGDHIQMSKAYMTFTWMINDIAEALHIKAFIN
jgi:hypothetical protein